MLEITLADIRGAQDSDLACTRKIHDAFEGRVTWHSSQAASVNGETNYSDIEDLAQDARLALWSALPKFRGESVGEFYKFIERTIQTACNAGRQGDNHGVSRATANRFERALRAADGDPYLAQILANDSDVMGDDKLSKEMANAARMAHQGVASLSAPLGESDATLGDTLLSEIGIPEDLIEGEDIAAAERAVERREMPPKVRGILSQLGETQRIILMALTGIRPVGLYGTENDTELAADYELNRKQIRVNRTKGKARFAQLWTEQHGEWV